MKNENEMMITRRLDLVRTCSRPVFETGFALDGTIIKFTCGYIFILIKEYKTIENFRFTFHS